MYERIRSACLGPDRIPHSTKRIASGPNRLKTQDMGAGGSQEAPPSDLGGSRGKLLLYTGHAMVDWLGMPVIKMPVSKIKGGHLEICDHFLDLPECLETKT